MAYNQDKNIIILDTQNWTVKKTLADEKVICLAHKLFRGILYCVVVGRILESLQIQCVFVFEMWQIYCGRW